MDFKLSVFAWPRSTHSQDAIQPVRLVFNASSITVLVAVAFVILCSVFFSRKKTRRSRHSNSQSLESFRVDFKKRKSQSSLRLAMLSFHSMSGALYLKSGLINGPLRACGRHRRDEKEINSISMGRNFEWVNFCLENVYLYFFSVE